MVHAAATYAGNWATRPKQDCVRTLRAAFAARMATGTTCVLTKTPYRALYASNVNATATALKYLSKTIYNLIKVIIKLKQF